MARACRGWPMPRASPFFRADRFAAGGALMSNGTNITGAYRQAGEYTGRFLRARRSNETARVHDPGRLRDSLAARSAHTASGKEVSDRHPLARPLQASRLNLQHAHRIPAWTARTWLYREPEHHRRAPICRMEPGSAPRPGNRLG